MCLQDEADFRHIGEAGVSSGCVAEKLLRTALLEEMLTEGEKSHSTKEGRQSTDV